MSLKINHITTYSTGLPSHIGVPAQNISNFQLIHVIPLAFACSFQIALLFWYFNLPDLLTDWHPPCSRCTVLLDSKTDWCRALEIIHTYLDCTQKSKGHLPQKEPYWCGGWVKNRCRSLSTKEPYRCDGSVSRRRVVVQVLRRAATLCQDMHKYVV